VRAKATFEKAEKLRAGLDGSSVSFRKVSNYDRVIRAYRQVYAIAPASSYADEALLAIAELHNQLAGDLKKPEYFQKAIEDYQFLLKEYPYSKYNRDALFTVGLIYQNDLGANEKALKVFEQYLEKFKQGPKVIAARENIRQIKKKMELAEKAAKLGRTAPSAGRSKTAPVEQESDQNQVTDLSRLPRVSNLRHWSTTNYTRVVLDIDGEIQFDQSRLSDPDRIFFDIKGTRLSSALLGKTFPVEDGFPVYNPFRLVIDVRGTSLSEKSAITVERTAPAPPKSAEGTIVEKKETPGSRGDDLKKEKSTAPEEMDENKSPRTAEPVEPKSKDSRSKTPSSKGRSSETQAAIAPHAAKPNSDGSVSLTRSLGLKIGKIVIDPGHGGHDFGTIGPGGLAEKDVVLDIAKRLGKLLEERLGSQVIYTRDDDTFVPLENRTALANQEQADLFISIHANSSRNRSATGLETFYLGIASSRDTETLDMVSSENAYSEHSLHDLQDVIRKITLNEKVEESKEFAADVQKAVVAQSSQWGPREKNRGVKKAHFIVLIGANMPSVLTEMPFLSNPDGERLLKKPENRQKIAQALYEGIFNYVKKLSGIKVAGKLEPER
jgi:N-acetylmuramoyl-L-alanine amidase